MEKIFYVQRAAFADTDDAVTHILATHFQLPKAKIIRTESGKPFLAGIEESLFFSVTHTGNGLFLAFSKENIGIDAERLDREISLPLLLKKFPVEEREEIRSTADFLLHWTVKESAVKWLGGTLARDLKKLTFVKNRLCYEGLEIPVYVRTLIFEDYILSVCCERDFSTTQVQIL